MAEPLKERPTDDGKKRGLGRGLSALLNDEDDTPAPPGDRSRVPTSLPIEQLRPGKFQPRRRFESESLDQLVESIREKGIIQPLLVRHNPDERSPYEIIAGERRWRAAQAAGLHDVPVTIRVLEDREALEVALIENIQRADLTPLEEAEGYRRLLDEFKHTQEALAQAVGKSRSHVANMLRLLTLPPDIKTMVDAGDLTAGHARALLNAADPLKLAQDVVRRGLNVRQTEQLAQAVKEKGARPAGGAPSHPEKDADTLALERDLTNILGLRVTIDFTAGGGTLTVAYKSLDQLDDVLRRLTSPPP